MSYTMGSLFAGIGGFDLGFSRAGFKIAWQVEIDAYAQKVLAKNFPEAQRYADIRDCGRANLVPVDVICGGFPCQDISNAGLRAGMDGERSGLWSEMHRIIGELRPRFALVENVAALFDGELQQQVLGKNSPPFYEAAGKLNRQGRTGLSKLATWRMSPKTRRLEKKRPQFTWRDAVANALQNAGALSEPSNFAPLHTNRIFTGLWTNRSPLRDAATSDYAEHYGMGRQDSIWTGYNSEISSRLTLRRRPGSSVYNATSIPPVKRFYSFNTFTLTDEVIRVMADTALTVYDATAPNVTAIFTKSAGAKSTYFLGVGNTLYFTNGVDNMQVAYNPTTGTWGTVSNWGIAAPVNAPVVSQAPRPSPPPSRLPNTAYETHNAYRSAR